MPKAQKGIIVISSGRTESFIRYHELIYDLSKQGYSVFIHDHRGQGFSERLLGSDLQKGHIDKFDYYVDDLRNFVKHIVAPKSEDKLFLIGHSMGGAIASFYLVNADTMFRAVALVSPMIEPRLPIFNRDATSFVCGFTKFTSTLHPSGYVLGETSYDKSELNFSDNDLTHSEIRFNIMHSQYKDKENFEAKVGGPTRFWLAEVCRATMELREKAKGISIPLLLVQAGNDSVVRNVAQDKFCESINFGANEKRCEMFVVKDAYHALFIEADKYRLPVIEKILTFFNSKL